MTLHYKLVHWFILHTIFASKYVQTLGVVWFLHISCSHVKRQLKALSEIFIAVKIGSRIECWKQWHKHWYVSSWTEVSESVKKREKNAMSLWPTMLTIWKQIIMDHKSFAIVDISTKYKTIKLLFTYTEEYTKWGRFDVLYTNLTNHLRAVDFWVKLTGNWMGFAFGCLSNTLKIMGKRLIFGCRIIRCVIIT